MKISRRQHNAWNLIGGYDLHVGIDNGVSGTIGVICVGKDTIHTVTDFFKIPVELVRDFQKGDQNINRVITRQLAGKLYPYFGGCVHKAYVQMERPFLNPRMFKGSISAARCHEATLIVMDAMMKKMGNIEFQFIDSKEWQKDQLPAGTKGTVQLKLRSMQYGCRLFPEFAEAITKHKDADGILIANYCHFAMKEYS